MNKCSLLMLNALSPPPQGVLKTALTAHQAVCLMLFAEAPVHISSSYT